MKLGRTKLTMGSHGCLVSAMSTIYQSSPPAILKISGGITNDGLVVTGTVALALGGKALPATKVPPNGWCIAVTDFYKNAGYPTHFFVMNAQTKQQIDPLDLPARVEPLSYPIVEYRPFTNVRLKVDETWQEADKRWAIENEICVTGWDAPDAPMSQQRVIAAIRNYHERFFPKS